MTQAWRDWAIPAICEALAGHEATQDARVRGKVGCFDSLTGVKCGVFDDWQAWSEHVAPLIADALDYLMIWTENDDTPS